MGKQALLKSGYAGAIVVLASICVGLVGFSYLAPSKTEAIGAGVTILAAEAQEEGITLDPFASPPSAVREEYCKYALQVVSPTARDAQVMELSEGEQASGVAPAVSMTYEDDAARSLRCEFVPASLIRGLIRISALIVEGQYLPTEKVDAINVALVHDEARYR